MKLKFEDIVERIEMHPCSYEQIVAEYDFEMSTKTFAHKL